MHADDDMRAPFFKHITSIAETALVKKLACLRAYLIYHPIEIFHPALLVPQKPVVAIHELFGDVMRVLDGADSSNCGRFTLPKPLQPLSDGHSGGTVSAAGVG